MVVYYIVKSSMVIYLFKIVCQHVLLLSAFQHGHLFFFLKIPHIADAASVAHTTPQSSSRGIDCTIEALEINLFSLWNFEIISLATPSPPKKFSLPSWSNSSMFWIIITIMILKFFVIIVQNSSPKFSNRSKCFEDDHGCPYVTESPLDFAPGLSSHRRHTFWHFRVWALSLVLWNSRTSKPFVVIHLSKYFTSPFELNVWWDPLTEY